ncbi:MAG: pseudaminic acid cytidylyltransferase [Bacteroidetes bacterium]|nr:pseudaminic acid cytidylyltransferase [Bacteroidota bacterium]
MRTIAIITARGGSKRIPRKNIKPFLGKPIIQYSIEAAINSECFDEVMVSTEDQEIAEFAQKNGANVPFFRSAENSDDFSTTADVLLEVLSEYKSKGIEFDYACCIYPTAPFVSAQKLKHAFDRLVSENALSVIPIVKFGFPILRSLKQENGFVAFNWPEYLNSRSQDLPNSFHDAGQFYFFRTHDFFRDKKLFTSKTIGLEMPESEVQDIDNEEDWKLAEIKYTFLQERNKKQ